MKKLLYSECIFLMYAHLVYTLCSADAIYTNFGIGGDGMLDAGSATPTMMGAGGSPSK